MIDKQWQVNLKSRAECYFTTRWRSSQIYLLNKVSRERERYKYYEGLLFPHACFIHCLSMIQGILKYLLLCGQFPRCDTCNSG